jgi:hypothetical protein
MDLKTKKKNRWKKKETDEMKLMFFFFFFWYWWSNPGSFTCSASPVHWAISPALILLICYQNRCVSFNTVYPFQHVISRKTIPRSLSPACPCCKIQCAFSTCRILVCTSSTSGAHAGRCCIGQLSSVQHFVKWKASRLRKAIRTFPGGNGANIL